MHYVYISPYNYYWRERNLGKLDKNIFEGCREQSSINFKIYIFEGCRKQSSIIFKIYIFEGCRKQKFHYLQNLYTADNYTQ